MEHAGPGEKSKWPCNPRRLQDPKLRMIREWLRNPYHPGDPKAKMKSKRLYNPYILLAGGLVY